MCSSDLVHRSSGFIAIQFPKLTNENQINQCKQPTSCVIIKVYINQLLLLLLKDKYRILILFQYQIISLLPENITGFSFSSS